ncbi:MAG TPA: hypothetical protein PLW14_07635 [Chlorobiota bacterium]|nr:hypothetical protein [Chlorobiota bacterium]
MNYATKVLSILAFAVVMVVGPDAIASSGGIFGRTNQPGPGCGGPSCHGSSASMSTTLTLVQAVNGEVTMARNETRTFTILVANANARPAAGVNVSVRQSQNASQRVGTFSIGDDGSTRIQQGEITHSGRRITTDGVATFTFSWTAPDTEGEYVMQAIGNAVDNNGSPGSGDQWNWMPSVRIVVSGTSSVRDNAPLPLSMSPVPAHDVVSATAPASAGESFEVAVMNAHGEVILTDNIVATSDVVRYVWNGTSSNGSLAAPGGYIITLTGTHRRHVGKAIIIR